MQGGLLVDDWREIIQSWLFPHVCVLCGAPCGPSEVCAGCEADLPVLGPACRRCAAPLPETGICGACLIRPPPYQASVAALRYAPPLDHLVVSLKFRSRLDLARVLGQWLAQAAARREEPLPGCLVPVPLHASRLRQRGYNQALEIARPVARRLGIALDPLCCRRVRATAAQGDLSARERRRNVRGAFAVTRALRAHHIAVVDDVMTTGSTVAEVARALRRAGARRVEVWTLARAVPPSA